MGRYGIPTNKYYVRVREGKGGQMLGYFGKKPYICTSNNKKQEYALI